MNALLTILLLSDTFGGRIPEKRIAEATPYPLAAGSRLLQALGFLAFTLPQVEILMPTKKPRGQELTREQHVANLCGEVNYVARRAYVAIPPYYWDKLRHNS